MNTSNESSHEKFPPLAIAVAHIPEELKNLPQWVCWKSEPRENKPTKIPKNPTTGKNANSTDPQTWTDFETALASCKKWGFSGIGFVFTKSDPYCGIDLDNCFNPQDGTFIPWALKILEELGSYAEISPSQKGVKCIVRAKLPTGRNRKGPLEMYDQNRYFTITGWRVQDKPHTINERQTAIESIFADTFGTSSKLLTTPSASESQEEAPRWSNDEVLEKARNANNGKKFVALYDKGEFEQEGHASQSEADSALGKMLWFWSANRKQVDYLFRHSKLMRPKWDEKHYGDGRTYGQGVLDFVCQGETYLTQQETKTFPLHALPTPVQPFVKELAKSLPVHPDMPAVMALGALSGAIGFTRMIRLTPDWKESAALYLCVVGDSGQLKSPCLKHIMTPLYELQNEFAKIYEDKKSQYDQSIHVYEKELRNYKNNKADRPPTKPRPPVMQRTWVADITVERLAVILRENPRGVLMIRDELSALSQGLNQYKGGKGSDRQSYLSAWSGAPISVDRQNKEPLFVAHPFLSIVGCLPPAMLIELKDSSSREDGFLPRILFSYPEPMQVHMTNQSVSDSSRTAYHQCIKNLFAWKPEPLDVPLPLILPLTPEAQKPFSQWHDKHCEEMHHAPPHLRVYYAKLRGYCARLSLVHALGENPHADEIGESSILAGIEITEYFLNQTRQVKIFKSPQADTPEIRCEREILRQLKNGEKKLRRQIQQNGNADASIFNKVWKRLLDTEVIQEIGQPSKKGTKKFFCLKQKVEGSKDTEG